MLALTCSLDDVHCKVVFNDNLEDKKFRLISTHDSQEGLLGELFFSSSKPVGWLRDAAHHHYRGLLGLLCAMLQKELKVPAHAFLIQGARRVFGI